MVNRAFDLGALVIGGVIVAALLVNRDGTATLINGVTRLWQTSINGLLGNTTQLGPPV